MPGNSHCELRPAVMEQKFKERGVGGIENSDKLRRARSTSQKSVSTIHPYFWAPFILVGDGNKLGDCIQVAA